MISFWEKNTLLNYDFIIVGSGILGLSVACEIKERNKNRRVLVLEKGLLPSGASTKNAGFACFGSLTEILADIKRIGKEEAVLLVQKRFEGIEMLRKRLGDENIGYINLGGYELLMNEEQIETLSQMQYLNDLLLPVFKKNVFELRNDFINEFRFNNKIVKALVFSPFESQIDTGKMMNSFIEYASSIGIRIINGCTVKSLTEKENYVSVKCEGNDEQISFSGKNVIICTNAFTSELIPGVKVNPGRGQVIVTKPVEDLKLKGVFHFDEGFYYFRNFDNRVIFGGGRNLDFEKEATTEFESNEMILNDLKEKLRTIILPGKKFEIESSWAGIMGFNEIKKPEIVKLSDRIVYGISCNGMGIALSSFVAKYIVDSIPNV